MSECMKRIPDRIDRRGLHRVSPWCASRGCVPLPPDHTRACCHYGDQRQEAQFVGKGRSAFSVFTFIRSKSAARLRYASFAKTMNVWENS